MHTDEQTFVSLVAAPLGWYYLILCGMNWVAALVLWRQHKMGQVFAWFGLGCLYMLLAPLAMIGLPLSIPHSIRDAVDAASKPEVLTIGSLILLSVMFYFRKFFSHPVVAWLLLNAALVTMGASMTDPDFAAIVGKPDNVPIVGLVYLLGFFTWLSTRRAVINDERAKEGLPPLEKVDAEKVLVWPDLVYTELICMVALTAFLLVWGIMLQAPLEEYASSVKTPNPSKAPWYFLGLQEMLVYFDPWMAGVVLPSVVIFGLMAIPFLDFNKQGNGYYTIDQRKFAYLTFQFGFLVLWVVLIILGTFFRGPNWNIFGPFEYWDAHKVLALNNIDLSQIFWIELLGRSMPKAPAGSGAGKEFVYILLRELPGIALTAFYLFAMPAVLAKTLFYKFYLKMGFLRFMLLSNLLLMMALLPIKMLLRWTINLKYLIAIPEYFLNL